MLHLYIYYRRKEEADSIARTNRQHKREEKRKRKALTKFRKQEEDKVSLKIVREEQKLIKAQRQLESMRLLDELFDRIRVNKKIYFYLNNLIDCEKIKLFMITYTL